MGDDYLAAMMDIDARRREIDFAALQVVVTVVVIMGCRMAVGISLHRVDGCRREGL